MSADAGARLPLAEHRRRPWRVHDIASDFELEMVWEFPIEADESRGETFALFCEIEDRAANEPLPGIAGKLVRLRLLLDALGLERLARKRIVSGSPELSVRERLAPEERAPERPSNGPFPFRVVYDLPSERLSEIVIAPVHALFHVGWVRKRDAIASPVMAVYVKPRGLFGRAYMAAIYWPRILVVYPALMRAAKRRWERRRRERAE